LLTPQQRSDDFSSFYIQEIEKVLPKIVKIIMKIFRVQRMRCLHSSWNLGIHTHDESEIHTTHLLLCVFISEMNMRHSVHCHCSITRQWMFLSPRGMRSTSHTHPIFSSACLLYNFSLSLSFNFSFNLYNIIILES
jgi:hypothetical protein